MATEADFEELKPLLQSNCERMQYQWANYEAATKQILANPDFGFILMAKDASQPVGFVSFTFEWSDWRDGAFFWMQGLQVAAGSDEAGVLAALKAALESHKATLDYRCCGIRLCTAKVLNSEAQQAITTFELNPSHYYIYHVDTVN